MKFKTILALLIAGAFLISSACAGTQDQGDSGGGQSTGIQSSSHIERSQQFSEAEIREVQEKLGEQGYDTVTPDGKLGPSTQQAIRDFQKEKGLPQTGQPDEQTRVALGIQENGSGMGGGQQGGSVQEGSQQGQSSQQESGSQPQGG